MGANSSVDTTSVAPFNDGSAGVSFVIQSLDLYVQALVEFNTALYGMYHATNYPKELTGLRDEISKRAILYKALHLEVFIELIDEVKVIMEYFIELDCESFKEHLNNILSASQICEARTSVVAAIHNCLLYNIDVIKEEAGAQRILAEGRFNHYKDIKDLAESEKRQLDNAIAQAVKDSHATNATASPSATKLPAVAGAIHGIAHMFKKSSSKKAVKSRHSAVNTPKCSNDEAVKAAQERLKTIIKDVEENVVKALEADIEMGRAKEAIDELAGSTGDSIGKFGVFVNGIAIHLNTFYGETLSFKARAIIANDTMAANRIELEYFMLQNKAKLILDKCKEFQGVVPIIQQRLSFFNVIGSDDGNKGIVEEWLTAEGGNLKLSESLIKGDSSLGTKYDFLLIRQRS